MNRLHQIAELAGIARNYSDVWGKEHAVSDETLGALLTGLGFACTSEAEHNDTYTKITEQYQRALPLVKVLQAEKPASLLVRGALRWQLHGENENSEGDTIRERVKLPALKPGYYTLSVFLKDETLTSTLLVAPPECWLPDDMEKGVRVWGIAAQLYSIHSARNMGMGDLGDLAELTKKVAALGCDVIGLNPLHAMFPSNPAAYSPYSPSNRLYLNSLYIDVEAVEGFDSEAVQQLWTDTAFQAGLNTARSPSLVDYPQVAQLKTPLLRLLFEHFLQAGSRDKYQTFCEQQGESLQLHALFDTLSEHFNTHWHNWPPAYHNPHSAEVKTFAARHTKNIEYYCWLQFVADMQLAKIQAGALQAGMKIGLYRDLAVGPEGAGAETWQDNALFIKGATVGAPPDEHNIKGQNWGLPALNPALLQELGLKPFIALVRANMRHCRALRIDHAFGLSRLYLVPQGKDASEGAYISYPFEALLAVLRIESHRNQCIVIGEDLGTFPPNYKEPAAAAGLFSYKVLYFEHDAQHFTPPALYPAHALATLSTHDLPTLAGWLQHADLEERGALSLYPSEALQEKDRASRDHDKELLARALEKEGLGTVIDTQSAERFLARSPAAIVMLQLEDILGVVTQLNLPATTSERPNWRMRLPERLDTIFLPQGKLATLAPLLNEERAKPIMDIPRATYRLQFHKGFTFDDAAAIVPYLAELGISHVYASPYLQARPGSTHGYDIIDHNHLNPELGGEEGYARLGAALQAHGLKQILDFVPNHMGVGADNNWWMSVLEWGKDSPHARYFDIDWQPRYGQTQHKILLPVLGNHYGDALAAGELTLAFDAERGEFYVQYFTNRFPICPRDYAIIAPSLKPITHYAESAAYKQALLRERNLPAAAAKINADTEALHALLERQHYRLAFWRVAASDINYRRFFDINELAGMRPEVSEVFDAMHRLVLWLIAGGKIHGLRIDHIDGLANPEGYCKRLKEKAGGGLYLTVEKILASHENLRSEWGIEGTSGYDALNEIAGLFVAQASEGIMTDCYQCFTQQDTPLGEMIFSAKSAILESSLASELLSLSLALKRAAEGRYHRDYTLDMLRHALREIIACFPVYRSYVTPQHITADDMRVIDWACGKAKKQSPLLDTSVYDFIAGLLKNEEEGLGEPATVFIRKFQQLSGPVMAKGLEDTCFYRFNRLLSLNEVGGDPSRFGLSVNAFHHINEQRVQSFPHTMIATATHDTKRGEDGRCRISMLSHIPAQWEEWVTRWAVFNRSYRSEIEGQIVPSANEEYALYQTLLGSWPVALLEAPFDASALAEYTTRITEYLTKSLREAKEHSRWMHPNEAYETAMHAFARALLDNSKPNKFLDDFLPAAQRIAQAGSLASLAQLTLKLTLPGVPDIYQGTEYWDLSLVDPDNRRPVDYVQRRTTLADTQPLPQRLQDWKSGIVKQKLMQRLLALRKQLPDLFAYGTYEKLDVSGEFAEHIVAFARLYGRHRLVVVVPAGGFFCDNPARNDARIKLPAGMYNDVFTEHEINIAEPCEIHTLLNEFPVGVFLSVSS